jgi:hypothetical protein
MAYLLLVHDVIRLAESYGRADLHFASLMTIKAQ